MSYFWLNLLPSKFKILLIFATVAISSIANQPIQAQITPDDSLGEESSVVTPEVEVKGEGADRIDGGAIRDRNLFHSFSEFNVGESQRVYFANPDNIEQIFTRVTGSNPSNINGTLGVDGAADLLLLNPNGIIFGENSSLDVEGSFFGTTADSLLFEDGEEFSATEPNSSLLTVSVPLGLQVGNSPGAIEVRSPLEVSNSRNFSLLGGNISLSGGNIVTDNGINAPEDGIIAPGGKVELSSLATTGIVEIEANDSLSFPQDISLADISLSNFAIDVTAGGGGSIAVNAKNLKLFNSELVAGIDAFVESTSDRAGDIIINTTEAVVLESSSDGFSGILNVTGDFSELSTAADDAEIVNTSGNAGNILINTNSLSARGFSVIRSITNGEGNAGSVNINAKESMTFKKPADFDAPSAITSTVFELGTGDGADIIVNTPSLLLDNASIATTTIGAGNAGDIIIEVTDSVVVRNNSSIEAATASSGNAGNIVFASQTADIAFEEESFVGTPVFSRIEGELLGLPDSSSSFVGTGRGGNLVIKSHNFSATNGVIVSTFTGGEVIEDGSANAGNIELNVSDSITVSDNSVLSTNTIGEGNAGNLTIDTSRLNIKDSVINATTSGLGNAGNINLVASELVSLRGTMKTSLENGTRIAAGLYTSTNSGNAVAGNITVATEQLTIAGGAQIQAATTSAGNGGNITVEANEIQLAGNSGDDFPSAITAFTSGSGDSGVVNLTTDNLFIRDSAGITVASLGDGDAGEIFALVRDSLKADNGSIVSFSDRSSGGEISISAGSIRLENSDIRTNVENGAGGGGNIILSADSIVAFDDSDIVASSADGRGGNITLNTNAFFASFNSVLLNSIPQSLNRNNRVDLSATGSVNGTIDIPEVNFLPNNLVKLSEETIDSEELVANSCVVRSGQPGGTFIVTGSGGLPMRPAEATVSDYATGTVRTIPDGQTASGKAQTSAIAEPEGVYRLANGKLVLSRKCK